MIVSLSERSVGSSKMSVDVFSQQSLERLQQDEHCSIHHHDHITSHKFLAPLGSRHSHSPRARHNIDCVVSTN